MSNSTYSNADKRARATQLTTSAAQLQVEAEVQSRVGIILDAVYGLHRLEVLIVRINEWATRATRAELRHLLGLDFAEGEIGMIAHLEAQKKQTLSDVLVPRNAAARAAAEALQQDAWPIVDEYINAIQALRDGSDDGSRLKALALADPDGGAFAAIAQDYRGRPISPQTELLIALINECADIKNQWRKIALRVRDRLKQGIIADPENIVAKQALATLDTQYPPGEYLRTIYRQKRG